MELEELRLELMKDAVFRDCLANVAHGYSEKECVFTATLRFLLQIETTYRKQLGIPNETEHRTNS